MHHTKSYYGAMFWGRQSQLFPQIVQQNVAIDFKLLSFRGKLCYIALVHMKWLDNLLYKVEVTPLNFVKR